jgi:Na+-transporting methylmalonyl-CoA/oxaloacetate decarboxylase gamma subunit
MKKLSILLIVILGISACEKQEETTSTCIESKIEAIRNVNKDYTSVKRFTKNGESF